MSATYDKYDKFDLNLDWQDTPQKAVSVSHNGVPQVPLFRPYSDQTVVDPGPQLGNLIASSVIQTWADSDLIQAGQEIADLLLPNTGIRAAFRQFRQQHEHVRLRLIYPSAPSDPSDAGAMSAWNTKIEELLKIPWEYAYLLASDNAPAQTGQFLGIDQDISIVHCLQQLQQLPTGQSLPSAAVDRIRFPMSYLWALGKKENDPAFKAEEYREARQDFAEEFQDPVLQQLVFCPNISEAEQPLADSGDVLRAFRDTPLVHIISHGEPGMIKLKDNSYLGADFVHVIKSENLAQPKVILLVSCYSAAGSGSVAWELHQQRVPMVIGMTSAICVPSARHFVGGFYKTLADGCVEQAVVEGRLLMYNEKSGGQRYAHFGLPRLFLYSGDSLLIPPNKLYPSDDLVKRFDDLMDALQADLHEDWTQDWTNKICNIKQWIESGKDSWYYVCGPSGSGKSTFVTRLIQNLKDASPSEAQPIIYFCSPDCPGSGAPRDFVGSVAVQLTKLYKKDWNEWFQPGARPVVFPLLSGNAEDMLRELVLEPLNRVLAARKTAGEPATLPIVILDGLEMVKSQDTSIWGLLGQYRDALSEVARFVITADAGSEADQFIRQRLLEHQEADLLLDPSGALPIYRRFLDRLQKQGLLEEEPPRGLDALYGYYLARITDQARQFLGILALAYEPLPRELVERMVGPDLAKLVSQARPFLKGAPSIKMYEQYQDLRQVAFRAQQAETDDIPAWLSLEHVSMSSLLKNKWTEWIKDSQADTHALFVAAYRPQDGNWRQVVWSGRGEGNMSPEAARYAWLYLAEHAYQSWLLTPAPPAFSKCAERAEIFLDLVCDPGFRAVRLANVGRRAALDDMRHGLQVVFIQNIWRVLARSMGGLAHIWHALARSMGELAQRFLSGVLSHSFLDQLLTHLPSAEPTLTEYAAFLDQLPILSPPGQMLGDFRQVIDAMGADKEDALTELEKQVRRGGGRQALYDYLNS